jgi:SAM-dependent methyltransferase
MSHARTVARRTVPASVRGTARRAYWSARQWAERRPQEIALERLVIDHGDVVQAGPFAGMRSLTTMDDGCIVPKLLGCYEEEVHHWIELLIARQPSRVIDVGCASGWYTTGLALRLPDAEVLGFDLEPGALDRARRLAELNGVQARVDLRQERLGPRELAALVEPGTVVIMDIDGPEIDVLVPEVAPALLDADVLVEFHDHVQPAISSTIVERFSATHDIQRTFALGRDPSHYRSLDQFRTRWVREAAVAERRPCRPRQEFALMLRAPDRWPAAHVSMVPAPHSLKLLPS